MAGLAVSTLPVTTMRDVRSPSTASLAVAPGSLKAAFCATVSLDAPFRVIAGGVPSARVLVRPIPDGSGLRFPALSSRRNAK